MFLERPFSFMETGLHSFFLSPSFILSPSPCKVVSKNFSLVLLLNVQTQWVSFQCGRRGSIFSDHEQVRKCPLGYSCSTGLAPGLHLESSFLPPPSLSGFAYTCISGEGSAHSVPSQVLKWRELTFFLMWMLRKFPSGSKVMIFSDHNEYKKDWVGCFCVY
jgi:hypothetical protein